MQLSHVQNSLIQNAISLTVLVKSVEIISGEIVLAINNHLPNTSGEKLNNQLVQIRPAPIWWQILPAERCCFCGGQTRFWSIKKKVPVCVTCANSYPEGAVPNESDWRNLP